MVTAVNAGTRSVQGSMIVEILFLGGLLCLSAFFSGSETALFALSDLELRELEKGSRAQRQAVDLARRPGKTLVTVLLANMIVNVLLSVTITSISLRTWGPSGIAVAIPVATVLLLLFGEIIPKSLGLRRRRSFAGFAALPLSMLATVLGPVRVGLEKMAQLVVGGAPPAALKREELPTLVSIAAEEGQVSPFESRVMRRVFRFADTPLARCLTPRVDMVALPADACVADALAEFERSGRSRVPVFQGGPDEIVGVVLQKDLLTRDVGAPDDPLLPWLRDVPHVPDTVTAAALFRRFQRERIHLAIVVDEHGGVEGLVTMEDLLEELIGDIRDESDEVPASLERLEDGSWRGPASLELTDVAEYLELPGESDLEESVTLSGVLHAELGRVPLRGDEVEWRGWTVRVLTASPTRARLVRLIPAGEDQR
ncbi:MAG: HlyC/CorC family transporter [Gemmatimonadetes bacterium]|nr:HlyC/CorC family transporter [Gemmatimonadota bacterium]